MKRIGIAGAGTMGTSMARIFAEKGYEVTMYNHRMETLMRARENEAPETAEKIRYTDDISRLFHQDIVIESLAEDMEIKKEYYRTLSEGADPEMIIATNTSGLSINELATAVKGPERFLGMHWFNPANLVPLVEIIRNDKTTEETAKAVYDLALAIGKKPAIVQKDVPGFAANRLQYAVVREALDLVNKGVISAEDIDSVMKYGLGFRWACIGPVETLDFGGLDVFYHISQYLIPDLCDSHEVPELLKKHFEAGEYGVKNGKGFYDYPPEVRAEKIRERDEKLKKLGEALG